MSFAGKAPSRRRELSAGHLALFAVAAVTGTRPIAQAAHAGPTSVSLWILAAAGVLLPLSLACAALTARYPISGGLYQWARNDFGPWHGFLCFWMYWVGTAFWFPAAAIMYVSVGIYGLGSPYSQLADNRALVLAASLAVIWIALGTNLVGLSVGKWTENFGAICAWLLLAALASAAFLVWAKHGSVTPMKIIPAWNWSTAAFWPNIAMGMTGFELIGMMGDEIADPKRDVPRTALLACLFAGTFYIALTVGLLVLIQPGNIHELYGLAQAGDAAGRKLGLPVLGPLVAVFIVGNALGQFGSFGSAASRLPQSAGVDNLLPAAFGRIHPRWGTPHVSMLLLGGVATFLVIAMQAGESLRGAYEALVSLMVIAGFLPFFYVYACAWRAGSRGPAAVGAIVTAVVVAFSAIPPSAVESVGLFEFKLGLGTAGMFASAWLIYRSRRQN